MKLKLRRVDKWGLALVGFLFFLLLTFPYLPPQRCEVHGKWLRRGLAFYSTAHADAYPELYNERLSVKKRLFPHTANSVQDVHFEYGEHKKTIRFCAQCRAAERKWLEDFINRNRF